MNSTALLSTAIRPTRAPSPRTSASIFASAGAANNPTLFRVTRSIFLNGAVGDIQVFGNQTGGLVTMMVETSHFLGGAGGDSVGGVGTYFPRSINIGDGVDYKIQDNHFDFCASPVNTGRAGIVGYYNQAEGVPTGNYGAFGRGQISGNSFNRMGRDTTNGQGPIDVYGYGTTSPSPTTWCATLRCARSM